MDKSCSCGDTLKAVAVFNININLVDYHQELYKCSGCGQEYRETWSWPLSKAELNERRAELGID